MFYAADSLVTKSVALCEPWSYVPTYEVSAQIRHDKQSRQDWYRHVDTKWNFYTPLEAANPNQRVSKTDNPPRVIHGFAADYDVEIPMIRIKEVIGMMEIKPSWIETSLGEKARLVWMFPRPFKVDNTDFCIFFLRAAMKWLRLDLLPGIDEGAFIDPTRLLCNGAVWESTGFGPIDEVKLQAFYVATAKDFRFISTDPAEVPLDVVEAKIKEKFPNFVWPTAFEIESQGPSFWVEGSTSSMSAIVKKDGMFTFSAHADKMFYSWGDILGKEFIKQFADNAIAKATSGIYFDNRNFWRKKNGIYKPMSMPELLNFFKVQCNLSAKPDKSGKSPVDMALNHIYNENIVEDAAPHTFRPDGPIQIMGKTHLNVYVNRAIKPVQEPQKWGPEGNFPFISKLMDNLFDPADQLERFLAWWKCYYTSAYTVTPTPGQNVFLMGDQGVGKTFVSQHMVGASVGGYVDAARFLVEGGSFNSELHDQPHWCIDDETVGENQAAQSRFAAILKKMAANNLFGYNKKFQSGGSVYWDGRVIVTLNMDYVSSRLLGPMDNSSLDKICLFRCGKGIPFPSRSELLRIVQLELPYFLRWLLDWEPPARIPRNVRFGYDSYHEPTLLDKAHQSSKCAPFKELLVEFLKDFFKQEKTATEWRGGTTQLLRGLQMMPGNETILRSMKLEQTNRYLEMIQREGLIKCRVDSDEFKTRIWVFERLGDPATPPQVIPPLVTNNNQNERKE